MSYARWSHSRWYVYWSTESGETRDEQRLRIWDRDKSGNGNILLEFGDVAGHFEACLNAIEGADDELRGYVREWLDEVCETAKTPGGFTELKGGFSAHSSID